MASMTTMDVPKLTVAPTHQRSYTLVWVFCLDEDVDDLKVGDICLIPLLDRWGHNVFVGGWGNYVYQPSETNGSGWFLECFGTFPKNYG